MIRSPSPLTLRPEALKLSASTAIMSENNRRARYYKLTPAGRKQLGVEMAEFEKVVQAITRVIQPA